MTILPHCACSVEAPSRPRQTSSRGVSSSKRRKISRADVGQRLVHGHAEDALHTQRVSQMGEEQRLVGDAFQHTGFARRDLADDGGEHRRALSGDRGHLHGHIEVFQRHVPVAFAERALRLEQLGVHEAFDDDFRIGGHLQIHRHGPGDANRRAHDPARHGHLVLADGELLRTAVRDRGRRAHHHGARHRFAARLVLLPVEVAAGAADARRHPHPEPVARLERAAVGAHVANPGVRIPGDDQRGDQVGRGVVAGGRDRHGQRLQSAAAGQRRALNDDLLARRRVDPDRRVSGWRWRASTSHRSPPPSPPSRSHRSPAWLRARPPPPACHRRAPRRR